jgi:amino acid adenylation domain-containing protein
LTRGIMESAEVARTPAGNGVPVPRVHDAFSVAAARRPDAVAVAAADGVLDYAQLERRSNQLAHRLRALGVTRETPVGLCLERSAALVVGALGILKAGGAYVALDPSYPEERIEFMLRDSGASTVIACPELAGPLAAAATAITLEPGSTALDNEPTDPVAADSNPGELAYVIYTSGSTGLPKGVLVEHSSLVNLVRWHHRAFSMTDADRSTLIASPGFDAVVWELWPALTAGASLHVPPDALRTDPMALRDWLVMEGITVGFLPTPLAETIIGLDWPATSSLRYILTGGDVLHRHPGPSVPFTLVNNYGPTEATVVTTSGVVPRDALGAVPSIGRPIDGVRVHIVDELLNAVQPGDVGELLIGGAGVARGYLNQPELTTARFVPDHFSEQASARLYRTGDLMRFRPDGELEFRGRVDEQIKVRGQRVEFGEIETILNTHSAVRAAVVDATRNLSGDQRLVAYLVPAEDGHCDPEVLRVHLARKLPSYMIPAEFVWLPELPMTSNGKVDRKALAMEGVGSLSRPADGSVPRNELEAVLVTIVAELLSLDAVGIDENFFLLGGHSLLGAQMIARIEERFGVELPLRDLFEKPTVAAMAHEIQRLLVADLDAMSDEEAERLTLVPPGCGGGGGH